MNARLFQFFSWFRKIDITVFNFSLTIFTTTYTVTLCYYRKRYFEIGMWLKLCEKPMQTKKTFFISVENA